MILLQIFSLVWWPHAYRQRCGHCRGRHIARHPAN